MKIAIFVVYIFYMKNRIVLVISLFLLTLNLIAQQEPFYAVFWNNPSIFNPATTGEQSKYYGAINYRNQWDNMSSPGNPWDISALFEMRFDSINSAFAINYRYDQIGLEKSKHIGLSYSYHIDLGGNRKIGIGISPTLTTKEIDRYRFVAIDDYTQDPSIPSGNGKLKNFDLNAGISYLSNKLRVGLGMTKIMESENSDRWFILQNQRHLLVNASYEFLFGSMFKLIPQTRFVTDFSTRTLEASLIAKYNNRYWIGASFRSHFSLGLMAGVDIAEKVRLGYAFDYYAHDTYDFNFGGAHEIVFAIMLN